jgi:hypothetical protein
MPTIVYYNNYADIIQGVYYASRYSKFLFTMTMAEL